MVSVALPHTLLSHLRSTTCRHSDVTSWRGARKSHRTRHTEPAAEKRLSEVVTGIVLQADRIQHCIITRQIGNDNTSDLVVMCDIPVLTLTQLINQSNTLLSAPVGGSGRDRGIKNHCKLSRPLYYMSRSSTMTSRSSTMTSRHGLVTSSRCFHTTPASARIYSPGLYNPNSPDNLLDSIYHARARYEAKQSFKNATEVYGLERQLKVTKEVLARAQAKAQARPDSPVSQAKFLFAIKSAGGEVYRIVLDNQFLLDPVIMGLLSEERGVRESVELVASTGSKSKGKWVIKLVFDYGLNMVFYVIVLWIMSSIYMSGDKPSFLPINKDSSYEVLTPDTTFADVAGNEHAVDEMRELVDFLTSPDQFTEMGCEIPKGYLLSGPPGVGKTLMAKALAGEANVPFYYTSASGFEEVFYGVGASRVRKLFEDAQANAPSVIFIDEIDSIGQKRKMTKVYSNRGTLNQMLSCMDGFKANSGVIVVAATNRFEDLDPALTREGRFDSKISIRPPPIKGRHEILKVHTRNKNLADDVDLENLARGCVNMTGAQLATVANDAGIRAVLENRDVITQDDFEFARAKLLLGHVNEDLDLTAAELENTAAHEAGHAVLTVLREGITNRPVYIATVLPRGNTLGHVLPVPKSDEHTHNIGQLVAQIDIGLAGRVGEELFHDFTQHKVTTGCSSDMQSATYYAEYLIKRLGYSDKIGLIKVADEKDGLTEKIVHDEIKILFDERYKIVKEELLKHKQAWRKVTDLLIEYKTLTGEEVKTIVEGGELTRLPDGLLPSH